VANEGSVPTGKQSEHGDNATTENQANAQVNPMHYQDFYPESDSGKLIQSPFF